MKSITDKLVNIHFDHALWVNELAFGFGEIEIYEKRIMDLIDVFTEAEGDIEELEDLGIMLKKFIDHKETIKEINSQIKKHATVMKQKVQANGSLKAIVNSEHHKVKEQIEWLRASYTELKKSFHQLAGLGK